MTVAWNIDKCNTLPLGCSRCYKNWIDSWGLEFFFYSCINITALCPTKQVPVSHTNTYFWDILPWLCVR